MDVLSEKQRHKNMRNIRSKDTKIELKLRKALWAKGYRYRKNYNLLPGKPDIVFIKYQIAIFCDSEFWHGKNWSQKKDKIQTNREYWLEKIPGNMARDIRVNKELELLGWAVLRFWGNDILKNTDECIEIIEDLLLEKKVDLIDSKETMRFFD